MKEEKILDSVYELAYQYEEECRGCAQSALAALQDVFEMRDDCVFKSASGLSGGGGLSNKGSCGALSGGIMAIGMLFGRERDDFRDPEGKRMVAYRLGNRLCEKFIEEFGSTVCSEIQRTHLGKEYDLWDADDYEEFDKIAYGEGKCPQLVAKAARWTAEIIIDEKS